MHCLDCRTAGTNSTAVGICQSCGAGGLHRARPCGGPEPAGSLR